MSEASTTTTPPPAGNFLDPAALMRIKHLELRARVVVEGFFSGLHRSPYHGFSVEFTEYRQYTPGDDPRYLDWKLFARSDRYYIKRFEDETNLRCHLVVDFSRSMDYGSLGYTKADYARTLAATLAYFLYGQRDAAGLTTFDDKLLDFLPPRYRAGHLRRLMLLLERAAAGTATSLHKPLERVAELLRKRGVVVVVSDLLAPLDGLAEQLAALVSRGTKLRSFKCLIRPRRVSSSPIRRSSSTLKADANCTSTRRRRVENIYVVSASTSGNFNRRPTAWESTYCDSRPIVRWNMLSSTFCRLAVGAVVRRGGAGSRRPRDRPEVAHELSRAVVRRRRSRGRRVAGAVPFLSPHAARTDAVQHADVSHSVAAARHEPQQAGELAAALDARRGPRAVGVGVRSAALAAVDGIANDRTGRSADRSLGRYEREPAA
ncbi:MAG: DUF58 domain-containing protein [Pirellulales bacterium]